MTQDNKQPEQTPTPADVPLWRKLNEARTQGAWNSEYKFVTAGDCDLSEFNGSFGIPHEQDEANAAYTALCVNNFQSVVEALEKVACLDGVYRDADERMRIALAALKPIS